MPNFDLAESGQAPHGDRRIARWQIAVSAVLLLAMLAPLGIAQLLVANDWILLPSRMAAWKPSGGTYTDNRFYDDDADRRLLNDVIPRMDYSRGSVCFFGSSRVAKMLMTWSLPPQEQGLIGNYAIGGATLIQEDQLLRYLVEERGLLKAGGDKTLVIFDLFFGEANYSDTKSAGGPEHRWQYIFTRDGLYSYDRSDGIHAAKLSPLGRIARIAEIHDDAFWEWLAGLTVGRLGAAPDMMHQPPVVPPEPISPEKFRQRWTELLGPDWRAGMDRELADFGRTIDYLQARHVHVAAVFLPQGSWFDDFPPAIYFRPRAMAMLASKSVPEADMSHLLPDGDFADSAHLDYRGVHETQPILIQMARNFLQRTGALPSPK